MKTIVTLIIITFGVNAFSGVSHTKRAIKRRSKLSSHSMKSATCDKKSGIGILDGQKKKTKRFARHRKAGQ